MHDIVALLERTLGRPPAARHVRLPAPQAAGPVEIEALWTLDGARPRWNNLQAAALRTTGDPLSDWIERIAAWRIPLGLVQAADELHLVEQAGAAPPTETSFTSVAKAERALRAARDRLFSPEILSRLRGDLPLDFRVTIGTPRQGFLGSHWQSLGDALVAAIIEAAHSLGIEIEERASRRPPAALTAHDLRLLGHITRVAVAYLGARVLEDKGFFGPEHRHPTGDPVKLINDVTRRTNGFFRTARDESLSLLSSHHAALQRLAKHLGGHQSFALVDDQDVAELYARALTSLPPEVKLGDEFKDLQQHYTPLGIARRMLERLPLERIPLEERRVFDPAAGSGSLLLEATRRLGAMRDRPRDPVACREWLASHVLGNDADPRSSLISGLRYTLVGEAFGELVPYPAPRLLSQDYRQIGPLDFERLPGGRPRIVVANPPYAEERRSPGEGELQVAAAFVLQLLGWLKPGDLFALVLPEAFLSQGTHHAGEAREALSRKADVFECWQLREGIVGTTARQGVCVLLGTVGRARYSGTIARKVQTGNDIEKVRREGFLGPAWAARIRPGADWTEVIDPPLHGGRGVGPIVDALYDVFCGPTPRPGTRPVSDAPEDDRIAYFRLDWQQPPESVELDPSNVNPEERYRRRSDLGRDARRHERDFDRPKLVFHNSTNRNTHKPLKVFLDRHGFRPDHNVHCLVVRNDADPKIAPKGWYEQDELGRLLWLLGILRSTTGRSLVEGRRSARHTRKNTYFPLPMPGEVDGEIVTQMLAWSRDPHGAAGYLERIDRAVQRSYGAPAVTVVRAGADPELPAWQSELYRPARTVRGHVAALTDTGQIRLSLTGLEGSETHATMDLPQDLPGWALAGLWFEAQLSEHVRSFSDLRAHPWALRDFRHPIRAELGSFASVFTPIFVPPNIPPEGLVREMHELQARASIGDIDSRGRKRLREIEHALDELENSSPQSRETRRREAERDRDIQRLLDEADREIRTRSS